MLVRRNGKWYLKNTAKYFGCSMGLVSENLNLFKYYDQLRMFKTRTEALDFYK